MALAIFKYASFTFWISATHNDKHAANLRCRMYEHHKREQYDEIDEVLAVAITKAASSIGFGFTIYKCCGNSGKQNALRLLVGVLLLLKWIKAIQYILYANVTLTARNTITVIK